MNRSALILVVSGEELWGVERLRQAVSEAGFQTAALEQDSDPEMFVKLHPRLVIANLSGSQAGDAQMCRDLSRRAGVPVIAIGSSRDEKYILEMFSAGANDYLPRPVNPRELVARARNILHRIEPGLPVPGPALPAPVVVLNAPAPRSIFSKISLHLRRLISRNL